jgi:hypothetical protein
MRWLSRLFSARPLPPGLAVMRSVVGDGHVVSMDGERVDSAPDYESVVRELAAISGGALAYDRFACTEEADGRRLVLHRGDAATAGVLRGDTHWIDQRGLLAILNEALRDAPGRLVTFDAGYRDQSVSFAYLTRAQADQLRGRVTFEPPLPALWKRTSPGATPLYTHDPGPIGNVALAVSADGALVASAGGDEVRLWDRRGHVERPTLAIPGATAVAFDARGDLLIGTKCGIRRGDRRLGTRIVNQIATDRARKHLVVGALGHASFSPPSWVEVWDLERETLLAEWESGVGNIHVAIAAAGDLVATASELDRTAVWTRTGTLRFEHEMTGPVWGAGFSPDGTRVVFGGEAGEMIVRAATDGAVIERLRADSVWSLACGADHGSIAVAGARQVQIIGPGSRVLPLPEEVRDMCGVAWLPDGGIVAVSCPYKKPARVYEWSSETCRR